MLKEKTEPTAIAEAIKQSQSVFIAGHLKPDGDTIGSALALASLLKRLGKTPSVFSKDPIPDYLMFLPGSKDILITPKTNSSFDLAIILECSDLDRMGAIISSNQAKVIINIDHHVSAGTFGHINYVNSKSASTAELIADIFDALNEKIQTPEAICLYVGVLTDTGKFQQSNADANSLRFAARMVDAGVRPVELYEKVYATMPFSTLKLFGEAFNSLKLECGGKFAYMVVTPEVLLRTGAKDSQTEGLINYTLMIPQCVVGALFRYDSSGKVKVSFRSRDFFDVNEAAGHFGGGGHKNASGCSVSGSIDEAIKVVVSYLSEKLS